MQRRRDQEPSLPVSRHGLESPPRRWVSTEIAAEPAILVGRCRGGKVGIIGVGAGAYSDASRRLSSAVEQRFCKPLVIGSIPIAGCLQR